MKKTIYFIAMIFITFSCTEKETKAEHVKIVKNKSEKVLKTENEIEVENNSDCVFDDNYKKVTEEWLSELEIKNYIWDSKINKAIFIYEDDTLIISSGGCNHFMNSVEIKTDKYPNKDLDDALLKKINNIACKFKFENYCRNLSEGKFKKIDKGNSSLFLEFEDEDPDDNLISEGIQISKKENRKIINISEYYN